MQETSVSFVDLSIFTYQLADQVIRFSVIIVIILYVNDRNRFFLGRAVCITTTTLASTERFNGVIRSAWEMTRSKSA
jgi:hypothetical protein